MTSQPPDTSDSGLDFSRVGPIFALVFVDVLGLTVILPLLHLYGVTFGASAFEVGLIAAAFPLAQLVGVPMMGAFSDRFGRKPLLLISQITTCASFLLLGFANSLALVIASRLLDGLFGANLATAQAALSDITSEENRAQGLGLTGAAFGLGFIVGPILSLVALELSGSLAVPAFTAAFYSFLSILLTLFVFDETLPPEDRGAETDRRRRFSPFLMAQYLKDGRVNLLLILMFAQQMIFFGFESLLGLFTLSQLGLLGSGNALIFLVVGIVLVIVQMRYIGKWSKAYGERKVVYGALAMLAVGLILLSFTPQQPHLFYVREIAENELAQQSQSNTDILIGSIQIQLPENDNRGVFGVLWAMIAIIPLSVGAGLIRPALNSMMTQRVGSEQYGSILGVSSSFVSAANASAPIIGGLLFQQFGATLPFLFGGLLMGVLFIMSMIFISDSGSDAQLAPIDNNRGRQ